MQRRGNVDLRGGVTRNIQSGHGIEGRTVGRMRRWAPEATSDLAARRQAFNTNSNRRLDQGDQRWSDIRGTTVTMLAEAACTLPKIVSITGHTLRRAQEILDKNLARTSRSAERAIAKFENVTATDSAKRAAK